MMMVRTAAAGLLVAVAAPASAQSGFGDTQLSYSGGVVTDDDLVPGRAPNQPYLVDEAAEPGAGIYGDTGSSGYDGPPLRSQMDSPNLIGPDGRRVRY